MRNSQFNYFLGFIAELFIIALLFNKKYFTIKWRYINIFGEIDLIAVNFLLKEVTFIEIKFRNSLKNNSILNTITERQKQRIIKSSEVFLSEVYPTFKDYNIRFDACFINGNFDFKYLKDGWRM